MDPTLLQALISGGGAVLGGLLGSFGTYLIAKKKLRHDAALHLYQKQLEACTKIVAKARQVMLQREASPNGSENSTRAREFASMVDRHILILPYAVIDSARTFWRTAHAYPEKADSDDMMEALVNLLKQAHRCLKIRERSKALILFDESLTRDSEPPRKASSGHGES